MLITIYITIMAISFIMLILSVVRINEQRNFLLSFVAFMMFAFLAIQAFQIQTENCRSLLSNSTMITSEVTTYDYSYDCQVNEYRDGNLAWLNIAFSVLSVLWGVANIFIKDWGKFR